MYRRSATTPAAVGQSAGAAGVAVDPRKSERQPRQVPGEEQVVWSWVGGDVAMTSRSPREPTGSIWTCFMQVKESHTIIDLSVVVEQQHSFIEAVKYVANAEKQLHG